VSESNYPDEAMGSQGSSYEADVDAGFEDDDPSGYEAGAGGTDADSATGESHASDVKAGYDDPGDRPGAGDDLGTGSY